MADISKKPDKPELPFRPKFVPPAKLNQNNFRRPNFAGKQVGAFRTQNRGGGGK